MQHILTRKLFTEGKIGKWGGGEQAKKRWQRSILILIQLLVPSPAATLDLTPLKSLTPTNPPNSASSILFVLL